MFAFLFTSAYVFVVFKGKATIIEQLEELTRRKVSIGFFDVILPFNLEIKNLDIEGLAKVENIFVSPSIPYFITGNIAFNNIIITKPLVTFEKTAPPTTQLPATESQAVVETTAAPEAKPEPEQRRFLRLIFKRLTVKDGRIDFIDHTVGTDGIKITVKDINFHLNNLYTFPFQAIANFELKGRIPWQAGEEEGKIDAEGWLNFFKRDMQALFKIEDIDGIYLAPYYSNWINLEKANIEKANLNFTSNIHGLNNNVTAECHLELTHILRKPRPDEAPEGKEGKVANAVLDMFKTLDQGKIALDFTIKTKMDRPEFGFGNIKMAVEDKIAKARSGSGITSEHILMLPAKLLEGAVKGATDLSKAVIDGTFAVGNELKKAVEDSFKKKPK